MLLIKFVIKNKHANGCILGQMSLLWLACQRLMSDCRPEVNLIVDTLDESPKQSEKKHMKLYVGNLSYQLDDSSLKEAFQAFGDVVSAKIIMDRESGRSKGFGFVEFSEKADAESAIEGLNGKELNGRNVNVSEARPPKPRTFR